MKKVALHGMVSSRNFGDILMVDIVSGFLSKNNYDVSVPMGSESVLKDLKIENQGNHGFLGFRKYDNLIFTGGGYFGPMENRSFYKDLKMMLKFASPAEFFLNSSQHHIIGVGVNNLNKYKLTQQYMKRFFNTAGTIAVRDHEGYEELRKIGIKRKDIEVLADIALNIQHGTIPTDCLKYADLELEFFKKNFSKSIALHLSGLPHEKNYKAVYDGLIKYANENRDIGFVLIEDHPNPLDDSPQLLAARYMKEILNERAHIVPYTYHWNLVALLSKVDGIITNKLHVAIVSSALNKIAISFTKHQKNHRFFAQIGATNRCVDLGNQTADSVFKLIQSELRETDRGEVVPMNVRNLASRNLELLSENLIK